jgi:hypothetical protein
MKKQKPIFLLKIMKLDPPEAGFNRSKEPKTKMKRKKDVKTSKRTTN